MAKVILGGGIGGLAAAHYLRKRFPHDSISIIEASHRTGGWIKSTKQTEGHIFEQGPRALKPLGPKGVNTLQLIQELGLEAEILAVPIHYPAAFNRMIYKNGQLHSLPFNISGVFKARQPFSQPLIRYLYNDLLAPQKIIPENDESLYSFVERRLGKEIADYAVSPLICGICAGNAKLISVKFLMETPFNYEQKYGSIAKGLFYNLLRKSSSEVKVSDNFLSTRAKQERWSFYSFKNGLETLPKRLETVNKEDGIAIHLGRPCTAITVDNKVTLETTSGEQIVGDHLISSVSSRIFGDLLVGHDELKSLLKDIPFVNVGVINLYYKTKVLNKNGFGFLIPPKENIPILGVIFDSCCFPCGESTVLTVMMGGYWYEKHFGKNPTKDALLEIALNQIGTILGIHEKPDSYEVNILHDCIPQYIVGHSEKVNKINHYIKSKKLPLSLCGISFYGVGVNEVIFSAKTAVDEIGI